MENKNLIKALRDEFAPRIRELCADDRFDCDKLCAGNILTAQCIVFQAADALEEQAAEIAEYLSIGTVEEFRALKEAQQKRQAGCVRCESPCQTCMIGCFKQEPDTCGGYTLPPMQYFCKTCGRDLRGESHE